MSRALIHSTISPGKGDNKVKVEVTAKTRRCMQLCDEREVKMMQLTEQQVRQIVREELAAHKVQPPQLQIRTVVDPQQSQIIEYIDEVIMPNLRLHHDLLKNLCGVANVHLQQEQPSKESSTDSHAG